MGVTENTECNSIHTSAMELSIQYHVTIINQSNDLNVMRYYIKQVNPCQIMTMFQAIIEEQCAIVYTSV